MVYTDFPDGVTSFGVPVIGPGAGELPLIDSGGRYWFVSSVRGDNGNTGAFDSPFATWAFAADATSGNTALRAGDVIVLLPDHAETVIAAGGVTVATAVRIVGIGEGSAKPTLTFGTSTAASVAVTADDVSIVNVIGIGNIDALLNPFNVTGDGFYGDIEWRDATNLKETVVAVKAEAVSNFKLKLKYSGFIDGSGTTAAFNVNGCSGVRVLIDAYGKFNTGVGRTVDVAATDVEIRGTVYKTGVTDGTKTFTDTATGSTWFAEVFDASAGATYAGGSATAGVMSAADPSAIGTDVTALKNGLYGTGIVDWPNTPAAWADGVSIAEVLAYVQDGVRRGSGTTLAANTSLQDVIGTGITGAAGLTLEAALGTTGTAVTDSAVSVLGAIGADNNNNAFASTSVAANEDGSVLERLEQIQEAVNKGSGTALGTNKSLVDALGTTGLAITDSAVSVIGVMGANNNDNAFGSGTVVANEDGSILERLEQIQEAVNIGSGTSLGANKSLVDALGTNGTAVTDSAVSVLGAIGADNAANAFSSASVVAVEDGSVLERLEQLQEVVNNGTGTSIYTDKSLCDALGTNAHAVTDSAVSVLGAIGADNASNAFASTAVVADEDGSVLERLEQLQEAVNIGSGTSLASNKSLVDAIGANGTAALTIGAGSVLGATGAKFIIQKSLTSSAIVTGGVDVTGAATGGDILIEDIIFETNGTGLATGTNFTLERSAGEGVLTFFAEAVASLGANTSERLATGSVTSTGGPLTLKSGAKLVAKSTALDCTGAGVIKLTLICRRIAAGSTLAAA